jgi:hypothetical protein
MVEQGRELLGKVTEELNKRKGHNGLQDDSGGLEDEHLDGAPYKEAPS